LEWIHLNLFTSEYSLGSLKLFENVSLMGFILESASQDMVEYNDVQECSNRALMCFLNQLIFSTCEKHISYGA